MFINLILFKYWKRDECDKSEWTLDPWWTWKGIASELHRINFKWNLQYVFGGIFNSEHYKVDECDEPWMNTSLLTNLTMNCKWTSQDESQENFAMNFW